MRKQFQNSLPQRFTVYADCEGSGTPVDVWKEMGRHNVEVAKDFVSVPKSEVSDAAKLDFNQWLPFAARQYEISNRVDNFIFVPTIIMPADLPNRNCVAFPLKELIKFNVEHGQQAYRTWKGKPVFIEHKNDVPKEASGVIVESFLRKFDGYGGGKVWKVVNLLAIDREKRPDLATSILNRQLNSYSMGAYVGGYTCSICNAELGSCLHLHPRQPYDFYEIEGKLCCRNVRDIVGFETSSVGTPAFITAPSDTILGA